MYWKDENHEEERKKNNIRLVNFEIFQEIILVSGRSWLKDQKSPPKPYHVQTNNSHYLFTLYWNDENDE